MKNKFKDITPEEVMYRYPRLVAHLIAESLGYFTPRSAALAIINAKNNEPYFCEWYSSIAMRNGDMWDRDEVKKVTKEVLVRAIKNRHYHKGTMSSYKQALRIVESANTGNEPVFASWF